MKLKLEINSKFIVDTSNDIASGRVMLTPPINEEFWWFRVQLSKDQAIVGFPKFNVVGIGFQKEEDWNTNLPSGTNAIKIYEHIRHNKGSKSITRGQCIEAILMIQQKVLEIKTKETVEKVKKVVENETINSMEILNILGDHLRKTGYWKVAEAYGQ